MPKLNTGDAIRPNESLYSVVFRGEPWTRITAADYDEAIAELRQAKSQLEPDGDNCHVCHDSGHQAWECHHNPLAMARLAASAEHQWRCFHCGALFTDYQSAREHFGEDEDNPAKCMIVEAKRDAIRLVLKVCGEVAEGLSWTTVVIIKEIQAQIIAAAKQAGIEVTE